MVAEISSAREYGTILTKVQNNSASDLHASEQLASQNSWQTPSNQHSFHVISNQLMSGNG